jgi:hypothetical protein
MPADPSSTRIAAVQLSVAGGSTIGSHIAIGAIGLTWFDSNPREAADVVDRLVATDEEDAVEG